MCWARVFSPTQVASGQKMLFARTPFVQRGQIACRPLSIRHFGCEVTHLLHMRLRPRAAGFQNATGRLPDDPNLTGQQSIGYMRRAVALCRHFSQSAAGLRVGLFLRQATGPGTCEALGDFRRAETCFRTAVTLLADLRLIEGGVDPSILGNPIETKCGMARVAPTYALSTISTCGNVWGAPLLAHVFHPLTSGECPL